eukprot:7088410-Lingulodinium_polyedra.AAC.1
MGGAGRIKSSPMPPVFASSSSWPLWRTRRTRARNARAPCWITLGTSAGPTCWSPQNTSSIRGEHN